MNEVIRAIEERRSVRAYTEELPEREKIDQVIEAALAAVAQEAESWQKTL